MCKQIFFAQTWIDFHGRSITLPTSTLHYFLRKYFHLEIKMFKKYIEKPDRILFVERGWSTLWVLLEISIPRNLNKCIILKPVWYDSIKFIRHVWPHSTLNEFTSYCKEQYCSNTLWIRSNLICVEKRFRT